MADRTRSWRSFRALLLTALLALSPQPAPRAVAATPGPVLPELVSRETQAAINKALEYLARTQRHDGSWSTGNYGGNSATMTSLAAIAMMANGSTPEEGPYARNVTRAMEYVLNQARREDGLICGAASGRSMYDHGFSMLFLAQCYGAEINPAYEERLHGVLTRAVELTAKSQSNLGKRLNGAGGWYYSPEARTDEGSVTVTQLQALRACRNVGIKVPTRTIERAVAYLRHCQMRDGGICYSANSRSSSRPPISAAALACFYAAGIYDRREGDTGVEANMVSRLWKYMAPHTEPGRIESGMWGHWYYMNFYLAQALYQRGDEDWGAYYLAIQKRLLSEQNIDGSWSGGVGSVYRTSIALTILQLPYNYLPICQP